jgi:hypothetical protein
MDNQVHETQRTLMRFNPKRSSPRYIRIELSKVKEKYKILKAAREKKVTYKGIPTRLTADLSAETEQVRREWYIIRVLKGKLGAKTAIPSKTILKKLRRNKVFLR